MLTEFQILASDSQNQKSIRLHSEIGNRCSHSTPLIPLESRFETSKFEFSALDLVRIQLLEFFFNQNLEFCIRYMDMIHHDSDAALDSTEPLLKGSNATSAGKSLPAAGSAMTLSASVKQQQTDKRASKIGQIWPGGRPSPTPSWTWSRQSFASSRTGQHSSIASPSPYQSPHSSHARARRGSASVPILVTRSASHGLSGATHTSTPAYGPSPQRVIYNQNTCLGAMSRRTTLDVHVPSQETRYSMQLGAATKGLGFSPSQNDNLTHLVHFALAGLDDLESIDSNNLVGDDADLISEFSDEDDNAPFFKIEDLEREAEMLLDESIAEVGVQRAFSRLKYTSIQTTKNMQNVHIVTKTAFKMDLKCFFFKI